MTFIHRNHNKNLFYSQLAKEIFFSSDFAKLSEELLIIYKNADVINHEREAFQDTFYSLLSQRESPVKAHSY